MKWLSTKDNNDKIQYKKAQAKIRRMLSNYRNEFWGKKCLEIQSYLGSKKCSESLLKRYVHQTVVRVGLT